MLLYGSLFLIIALMGFAFRTIIKKIYSDYENTAFTYKANNIFSLLVDKRGAIVEANEQFLKKIVINIDDASKEKKVLNLLDYVLPQSIEDLENIFLRDYIKDFEKLKLDMCFDGCDVRSFEWNIKSLNLKGVYKNTFIFNGVDRTDEENYVKELDAADSNIQKLCSEISYCESMLSASNAQIKELEKTLNEQEANHNFIMESINVGVWEFDYVNAQMNFSEKCSDILRLDKNTPFELMMPDILDRMTMDCYFELLLDTYENLKNKAESFVQTLKIQLPYSEDYLWVEFAGSMHYDEYGHFINAAGSFIDMTENKQYEYNIEKLAFGDILTGLYNRVYMKKYINDYIINNPAVQCALVFFDIDDFRYINESFGHSFGDSIITSISKRVIELAPGYAVSRFSGDEVAIFVTDYSNMDMSLTDFVQKLTEAMNISYYNDDLSYRVSVSVGVSLYPQHGNDFETLLQCADIALNEAKNTGKNKFVFYTEKMDKQLYERMLMERDLRHAIETSSELVLYLQPQYCIKTGELSGFESLSRWINSARGFVSPLQFIKLAEETRLIMPLGRWVFYESCKVIKELSSRGYNNLKISVNLSPIQLLDDMLILYVKDVLEKTQINPNMLELEITENILMENFESNIYKLEEIKRLGISIVLDDFGTGYSSLTYLKVLPISKLKIDKSFIDNIVTSEVDKKITQEIVSLAHVLNLDTIAEGVETVGQLSVLSEIDCDVIQGYLGGKPMPHYDIYDILEQKLIKQ